MRRKGLAYLMTAVMICGMLLGVPATSKKVEAATVTCGGLNVTGGKEGTDFTYDSTNGRVVVMTSTALTFTSTSNTNTTGIYVNKDVDANITLDGVFMRFKTQGVYEKPGIEIADDSSGDVVIYIKNKTRIHCQAAPAIQKNGVSGSLTIDATDSAKSDYTSHFLFAKTDGYYVENSSVVLGCAAIGGATGKDSGNITVKNGMVYAVSSSMGAAIGGGANGDGTDISVTGGKVYALVGNTISVGDMYTGAAIGGGYQGNGEDITISGGEVLARFYENGEINEDWIQTQADYGCTGGAGIGGGYNGNASDITISGGSVTAMGDTTVGSAGIGAGEFGNATGIEIIGGSINATGGNYAAGIGSGRQDTPASSSAIPNTDITITGGTIVAIGGTNAPGVGAGSNANVFVRIGGGSVKATAGSTGADAVGFGTSQKSSTGYTFVKNVIAKESEKNTSSNVVSIEEQPLQFSDKNTDVSGRLEFKYTDETAYTDYITNGMVTDDSGYVYPYLPSGVKPSKKSADGALNILYNGAALESCYNQYVSVSANGYQVSKSSTSGFDTTCTLTSSGTYTLYFKGVVSGNVTSKTVTVNIDMTAPTGMISLDGKDYNTANGNASIQYHTLSNDWVTIHCYAEDKKSVQYALANAYYSESNIESNVSWTTYNHGDVFQFPSNEAKAIYVKLTDTIGNVRYLSTPVIYNDTTAPTNTASASNVSADSATISMSVKDSNNIDGITRQYAYVLLPETETAPTDWASLTSKITSSNGAQGSSDDDTTWNKTFTGLTANTTYKLYMMSKNALTNLSGKTVENVSGITTVEFTTSRLTASASNQSLQVKQEVAGTNYQYDLKQLLSDTVASKLLNPSYTCTVENGSVVNATGKLDVSNNGVVTIPFKSNLSSGATQELQVSITSDNYETISGKLTIEITSKTNLELSGVSVTDGTFQEGLSHGYDGTIQWMSNGQCLVDASGTDVTYIGVDGTDYSSSETAPTNAGTYQVTFSIKSSNENYVGTRSYTFEINKASLRNEMSNVAWYMDNATKITTDTYSILRDGNIHTVSVKGYSDKVEVNYERDYSNNAIGSYTAIANFNVKNEYARNYDLPSDLSQMTLTWKIADKITPDMSQVSWVYEQGSTQSSYVENVTELTANGNAYTVKVVGVPEGVQASYTGTCSAREAGTYQANVTFTVSDTAKYHSPNPSSMTLTWKIAKASSEEDDNGGSASGGTADGDKEENGGTTEENTEENTEDNANNNVTVPTVGDTKVIEGGQYKVTTSAVTGGTVEYIEPVDKKNASKVTIPATITIDNQTYKVTTIAKNAFSGCKKLSKVTIPNGIITIGANAFKGCVKLTTISIPNSVESIGANAFSGCKKLKTVTLKSGSKLKTIGDKAFYKCVALTKITITKNVTKIGKSAFFGCKKLKTITIKSKKLKSVGTKAIKGIHKKATIKCPGKKYVTKYKKLFKSKTGYVKTMKFKK